MKRILVLFTIWILLFIPVTLICTTLSYGLLKINYKYLNSNINKKFELNHIVDTLGNKTTLNFNNKITIIDFWFRGCPPCVHELGQYESLLKGRENEISIYSISIDDTKYWKSLFLKDTNFPVLRNKVKNWKHYAFDSTLSDKGKYLHKLYNIKRFPFFIVVDNKGKITEVPTSAVSYIKENYQYKNFVLYFWNEIFFAKDFVLIRLLFIPYTILFWLATFLIFILKKETKETL